MNYNSHNKNKHNYIFIQELNLLQKNHLKKVPEKKIEYKQ